MEFTQLFDVKLIDQLSCSLTAGDIIQTVELLSHMTCFDLYKAELLKRKPSIKLIFEKISSEVIENSENALYLSQESDNFNIFYGILQIAFNLCLDKKQEMVDHYKKNYEISDEDFHAFEQMQMKYNKDSYNEGVQHMTYDKKTIQEYEVKAFLSKDIKIIRFLSYFIENFQKNFSFQIQSTIIKLLILLSQEQANLLSLFDLRLLKYFISLKKPEKEDLDFTRFRTQIYEVLSKNNLINNNYIS